jgi:ammonium transporter, Amt family
MLVTLETIILWIMHFIPGLRLLASEEAEIMGIDDAEMGEYAYDYVELDSELGLHQHPHRIHEIPNLIDGVQPHERRGGHTGPEDVTIHAKDDSTTEIEQEKPVQVAVA